MAEDDVDAAAAVTAWVRVTDAGLVEGADDAGTETSADEAGAVGVGSGASELEEEALLEVDAEP